MSYVLKPIGPEGYFTRHLPGDGPFQARPAPPALVIRIHQLASARAKPTSLLYIDAIKAAALESDPNFNQGDDIDIAGMRYNTLAFCLHGSGFGCWDISALSNPAEAIPLCIVAATAPLGLNPEDVLEFYEDPFMQLLEAIITWRDHAVETAVLEEARTTLQSLKAHPTHDHLIPQFELEIGNMEKRVAAQARRLIR